MYHISQILNPINKLIMTSKQMDLRRKQQQEKFDIEKAILKAELAKKRMHEQMQEKWNEREKQEEVGKTEIAQELRRMKSIDFEEIKEHSKKYDETMKAQRESRVNVLQSSNVSSFYHSNFRDAILEEEQRKKEEEHEKQLRVVEFFEKRKAYGEEVRVNHKPMVKNEHKESRMVKNEHKESSRANKENTNKSLSLLETHKRGNEYMKSANTALAQILKENPDRIKAPKNEEVKAQYKNYLQELRRENDGKQKTESDEVQQILRNNNLSQQEKLFRMKLIAEKMQSQRNRQSLMKSINLKLKILQQMPAN